MRVWKEGKIQWLQFWNHPWTRLKALPNELITGSVVFLGLTVGIVTVGLNSIGAWQTLEWQGYRLLFAARQAGWFGHLFPSHQWDDRLVVITIDDQSLRTYGQFATWKRDRYTELLQTLQASPPAALGFALLFPEATPEDASFAEAMAFNGTIVLGIARDNQGHTLFPRPFLDSIAALGHVQSFADSDGITRSSWLYIPTSTDAVPSLSVSLAQVYNQTLSVIDPDAQPISIPEPQATLEQNLVWINWPAPSRKIPQHSLAAVLNYQVDPSAFADKIVLVGISATGLESNPLRTPFDADANGAGVYLYAAILDNLLNDRFLRRPDGFWVASGLMVLSLAGAFFLHRFSLRLQLLTLASFPVLWLGIALVVFHAHWWIPVASPIAALWLVGILLQLRAHNDRQLLMDLFSKHVSSETAKLIWEHRTEIFESGELQAQELTATVLFMDIRGFTTISEQFKPAELLRWLNRYLDAMTDCIMAHGGVVDKYIGDAIMAVFGIPIPRNSPAEIRQDALNAIAAGIAMHDRLQSLNHTLKAEGLPTVRFGIGIHTGNLVAGSVGGSQRLNYSVVGDTVNVAARIEALNKNLQDHNPYDLLISGHTFAYVRDQYDAKPLQALQLRGKAASTVIYGVQGKSKGTRQTPFQQSLNLLKNNPST